MTGLVFADRAASRIFVRIVLAFAVLCILAPRLFAISCVVVHHKPPTEADKALLAADFDKAASLYRAELSKHPGEAESSIGLVHALLSQQKVQEAADAVKESLAAAPNSPALITLRGEVEYRQGTPWLATQSAEESGKLDPCNPRNMLLIADIADLSSLFASARKMLMSAHRVDPEDPEIRYEWLETLPLKQRIPELEAYLAAPRGDDAGEQRHLRMQLEYLKKRVAEPHKSCHLVSSATGTEIPFTRIMYDATHMEAFGLEVKFNNRNARLEIDTGAGGLTVTRSVAEHAGLKPISQSEMGGIGDQGYKPSYTAYADSIRVGGLEFKDCTVDVVDNRHGLEDADGLIGMDVFSRFLVTLDYPMRKLLLGPLPARPGELTGVAPALKMDDSEIENSDNSAEPANPQPKDKPAAGGTGGKDVGAPSATATSDAATAAPKSTAHGPYDRYIAPEMKDYTPVYRVGHELILPASLNGNKLKLFIMDTGAFATTISPAAAREVTKVHRDGSMEVEGLSGTVDKVYSADEITFGFAHIGQKVRNVVSFDTAKISKDEGIEISGFIGATALQQLTIHIDYRDGLVKFDYDAKRGN
jgi:predicted aspartyl protease